MLKGKKFDAFTLKDIASLIAQQLLCDCMAADMHMYITCCACVYQLLGGLFGNRL